MKPIWNEGKENNGRVPEGEMQAEENETEDKKWREFLMSNRHEVCFYKRIKIQDPDQKQI